MESSSSALIGKNLKGRYRVDEFIGRGGMADVYKVWDSHLSVHLGMKLLHDELAEDRVFLRRFKREAHTLERLKHPNIVRFYGIDQDDIRTFILMDFVEGTTLRREIFRSAGPMKPSQIMEIMRPVCAAIGFAHREGVVHCDVKPANVMIDSSGRVLVADFGISRMTDAATATMVGMGTPAYMAPELVIGQDPTPETDIYSLGVILYEMVTGGERPFTGEHATITGSTSEKVRWEQRNLEPPSPRKWNPEITDELVDVIMKCLAKDPSGRYGSAQMFLDTLTSVLPQKEIEIEQYQGLGPEPADPEKSKGEHPPQPGDQEPKSVRIPPIAYIIGGVIIVGGLILLMMGGGNPDDFVLPPLTDEDVSIPRDPTASVTEQIAVDNETKDDVVDVEETPKLDETEAFVEPTNTPTIEPTRPPQDGDIAINNKDDAEVIYISAGEFMMGASPDVGYKFCLDHPPTSGAECNRSWYEREAPAHEVQLSEFWIYAHEVSIGQYSACVRAGACTHQDQLGRATNLPVTNVSWDNAREYCQWAGYDLPTEAQWEYAAKGPTRRSWPWGDSIPTSSRINSRESGQGGPKSVYSYEAGGSYFGLANMAGNVWELVKDPYQDDYYRTSAASARDPEGPSSSDNNSRVMRGGGFDADYNDARVTARQSVSSPGERYYHIGFRCAGPNPL